MWPVGIDSVLQDRFKNTDWSMFATQATIHPHIDIESYASSVMDYISTTIDSVTTHKQITMYPNQKPWMNRDVRLLLKARNTAFRSEDAQAYSTARADLKWGIKKAKHCFKLKVEEHFSNSNSGACGKAFGSSVTTSPPTLPPLPMTHAQSMRWGAGGGPDGLIQSVPGSCCCSNLLQIYHHRAGTKTLHSTVS